MASRVVGTVRAVAKKRLIPTKAPLVLVRDMFLMFHLIFVNDEKLQVFTVLQYYNLYSYLFVILKVNVTDIVSCLFFLCKFIYLLVTFYFCNIFKPMLNIIVLIKVLDRFVFFPTQCITCEHSNIQIGIYVIARFGIYYPK